MARWPQQRTIPAQSCSRRAEGAGTGLRQPSPRPSPRRCPAGLSRAAIPVRQKRAQQTAANSGMMSRGDARTRGCKRARRDDVTPPRAHSPLRAAPALACGEGVGTQRRDVSCSRGAHLQSRANRLACNDPDVRVFTAALETTLQGMILTGATAPREQIAMAAVTARRSGTVRFDLEPLRERGARAPSAPWSAAQFVGQRRYRGSDCGGVL